MSISKTLAGYLPAMALLSVCAAPVAAAPTVDGLFDQVGEGYSLLGSNPDGRGDLYFARDGNILYLLVQLNPETVNDTVFGKKGGPGPDDSDYLDSAGWNNHNFQHLEKSDNLSMLLECNGDTFSWAQDLLYPADTVDPTDPMATIWLSDINGPDGGATNGTPSALASASSIQWNMNNSTWDITLGGTRTDALSYKSPFTDPDEVPASYSGFDAANQWEWSIIYEMSLDLNDTCNGNTASASVSAAHNSPSKSSENVEIPGGEIPEGETVSITIIKATTPAGGTGFEFDGTPDEGFPEGCDLDSFTLDDTEQEACGNLSPGQYTITESSLPTGWSLDSIDCEGDGFSVNGNSVDFDLEGGESATCTFNNLFETQEEGGSITIIKQTIPDGATQSFDFTGTADNGLPGACESFSLEDDQSQICDGLGAGSYTFTETVPANWSLDDISCEGATPTPVGSNGITVTITEAEEDVVCTFTNDQQVGQIQIEKLTDPSGSDMVFDFTAVNLEPTSFSLKDGETRLFNLVPVGDGYSVDEIVPEGWELVDASCDDGTSTPENIDVQDGEIVTCTFTNKKKIKAIPALSPMGMALTALLLGLLGILGLRYREHGLRA